jgi:hypothetical protein
VGRGAFVAVPVVYNVRKKPTNQKLTALLPTASTLLHEMFHLVLGNAVTRPAAGEVYNLLNASPQIVGLKYDTAVMNAESYTLAAIAYDYTLHTTP